MTLIFQFYMSVFNKGYSWFLFCGCCEFCW